MNLPPSQRATFLGGSNKINYIEDYGAEAGGPIIKDHLWLWGAYGRLSKERSARMLSILGWAVWVTAAPAACRPQHPAGPPDVVGVFYRGDMAGLEECLTLRPDHTFRFAWQHFGNMVDEGHGQVLGQWRLDGRRLALGVNEAASDNIPDFPLHYVAVPWGPRLYLVLENQMAEFCDEVNGGFEPGFFAVSHYLGRQFLRDGDWKKPAPGKPHRPEEQSFHSRISGPSGRMLR